MSITKLSLWFEQRPKWMQEAAKKLLEKGELENADINELESLCVKEAMGEELNIEFMFSDDTFIGDEAKTIKLISIGNIKGINALAPRSPIEFGENNLSVIYGVNGSGKSGYGRILKHTCGSRYPGKLLSNVYSPKEENQECHIKYLSNSEEVPIHWKLEDGVINDLRSVDIFDANCGLIYLEKENEVTYEPPILLFFSQLIDTCESVSSSLGLKRQQLPSKLPELPSDLVSTQSGNWYLSLKPNIHSDELKAHCFLKEEDAKTLDELTKRLTEPAPLEKAKELEIKIKHARELIDQILGFHSRLSNEICEQILSSRRDLIKNKKASELLATKAFELAPLKGVGSEIWEKLWEYARRYSVEHAYKGLHFPNINEESVCVLCQQPLSEEARQRFQSFEDFVKGESKILGEESQRVFDEMIKNIGDFPKKEGIKTQFDAAGLDSEENLSILETAYSSLEERKNHLLQKESIQELETLPDLQDWVDRINSKCSEWEELAGKYKKDNETDNRKELEASKLELRGKKWLSEQSNSIKDEIDRLNAVNILQKTKALTDTTGLSRKKGELAEALITDMLIERFQNEISELGAKNKIKIKVVKTKVEKGRVLHCFRLAESEYEATKDILSEGEQRVVSLAAFLADVTGKNHSAPFVFDDPITSLDQDYEEALARRLIKLSKDRQVIIFTHRLSLLGLIQHYGKKDSIEPNVICVSKEPWGTGEPGEVPVHVMKPEKALNHLLNERLVKAGKALNEEGKDSYAPLAKSICSDFRILLERMIENDLLADVVQRFRRAVTTEGKIIKLSKICESDCKYFDEMMTKYSRYEHSQPEEAPVELPQPDELKEDLESLKNWRTEFVSRV